MKASPIQHASRLLALLGLAAAAGCGTGFPTQPHAADPVYTGANPPPALHSATPYTTPLNQPGPVKTWQKVGEGSIRCDEDASIRGGRYELSFPSGALDQDTDVTIEEWESRVLEVQFGPHGTAFRAPVRLTIDYAGTNADPSSSEYDGSKPVFYWYNEATDLWEEIPGQDNPGLKQYSVNLEHFSVYILSGKAGW